MLNAIIVSVLARHDIETDENDKSTVGTFQQICAESPPFFSPSHPGDGRA